MASIMNPRGILIVVGSRFLIWLLKVFMQTYERHSRPSNLSKKPKLVDIPVTLSETLIIYKQTVVIPTIIELRGIIQTKRPNFDGLVEKKYVNAINTNENVLIISEISPKLVMGNIMPIAKSTSVTPRKPNPMGKPRYRSSLVSM